MLIAHETCFLAHETSMST